MAACDREEVYTLLLTGVNRNTVSDGATFKLPPGCDQSQGLESIGDGILKKYYHDHLLRSEIGKVISIDFEPASSSAIVKIKVKSAAATGFLEEVQGNLRRQGRSETAHFLYSESCAVTFNWNTSMKHLAGEIADYAKKHYPTVGVKNVEGVQTTITGTAHDIFYLQHQYTNHIAKSFHSLALHREASSAIEGSVAVIHDRCSKIKEYPGFNPDALALLRKKLQHSIPGVSYDIDRGYVLIDSDSVEEKSTFSDIEAKYCHLVKELKADGMEVPEELSDEDVVHQISTYDARYGNCVFLLQRDPRAVKVISNSSRQFDQAKKMLRDEFWHASNKVKELMDAPTFASKNGSIIPIPGGRRLTLKQANIVLEEVDVIVNAANRNLEHGGGVAGAINKASKGAVQKRSKQHIKQHGRLQAGQVAVTGAGGSLKCKHIIHAVGPMKSGNNDAMCERLLYDVVENALREAENLDARSVSLPAISSGIFGVATELVAKCVIDSVLYFKYSKPPPVLSDIRIVIIDNPTHSRFAQYFARKSTSTMSLHKPSSKEEYDGPSESLPFIDSSARPSLHKDKLSKSILAGPCINSIDPSKPLPPVKDVLPATKGIHSSSSLHPSNFDNIEDSTTDGISSLPYSGPSSLPAGVVPITSHGSPLANTEHCNITSTSSHSTLPTVDRIFLSPLLDTIHPAGPSSLPAGGSAPTMSSGKSPGYTEHCNIPLSSSCGQLPAADGIHSTHLLHGIHHRAATADTSEVSTTDDVTNLPSSGPASLCAGDVTPTTSTYYDEHHKVTLTSPHGAAVSTNKDIDILTLKNDAAIIHSLLQVLANKWHILGHLLGFDETSLAKISSVAGSTGSYLDKVITGWLYGNSNQQPTLEGLIMALRHAEIGGDAVATQLLKVYSVNTETTSAVKNENPKIKVSEEMILPFVESVCSKWRLLGIVLGASQGDLLQICGDPMKCLQKVISLWLSGQCSKPPTLECLTNALRSFDMKENHIAAAIEQAFLKKACEDHTLGTSGDGSEIHYPSLPPFGENDHNEEEKKTESKRKVVTPPPGFRIDHEEVCLHSSSVPRLLSMSDAHSYPPLSLEGNTDLSGARILTSGTGENVTGELVAAYNLSSLRGNCGDDSIDKRKRGRPSSNWSTKPGPTISMITCSFCQKKSKSKHHIVTECKHVFCQKCFDTVAAANGGCPMCYQAHCGNQPPDYDTMTMTHEILDQSLPGYEGHGTIQIIYEIQERTQGLDLPNPDANSACTAYLPYTQEGCEVFQLLKKAFDARLIFTTSQSATSDGRIEIEWSDIHLKTSMFGGGIYGYPDSTYLQRLRWELTAKGIVPDNH